MTRFPAEHPATSALYDINVATLYEQLGASHGIRRIVDGTVAAHLENPIIKHRFEPYLDQPDRVEEIKRQTCLFFSEGSGGPDTYRGRSMSEAHRGMDISEAEYEAAVDDILGTMKRLRYAETTTIEVSTILHALKADIVHA